MEQTQTVDLPQSLCTQKAFEENPERDENYKGAGIKTTQPEHLTGACQNPKDKDCEFLTKACTPQKQDDIQDEMEKYFEEFGVMQTTPSSKRLQDAIEDEQSGGNNEVSGSEQGESNIDQEQLYRYKQLESKLNLALNKIEICRDSSVQSLKATQEDTDEMCNRFEYYEKKKKEGIQRRKQEKQLDELREMKKKPTINPVSNRLVGRQDPIYNRYDQVLNQKQKKLEAERCKLREKQEAEEEEFARDFEERNRKPENARSAEEFYAQLVRWKEKKEEKNKQKLESLHKEELSSATFQPEINPKSKRLAAKKPEREPIFTREPKCRPVAEELSFMPKINKKIKSYT